MLSISRSRTPNDARASRKVQMTTAGQEKRNAMPSADSHVKPKTQSTVAAPTSPTIGQSQSQRSKCSSYLRESFSVFKSAEFTMTERELRAIAAAAMIGLRKPKAAIGMPIAL